MAVALTGLGRRGCWPAPNVCAACSSDQDASRGYPGDVWYCWPCAPIEADTSLAACVDAPAPTRPAIAAAVASDLFSGFAPA